MYIIPSALKRSISMLKAVEDVDMERGLYGIVVAREEGPSHLVNGQEDLSILFLLLILVIDIL